MDRRGDWDSVIVGQERGLGWGYSWAGRGDWDSVIVGQERGLG